MSPAGAALAADSNVAVVPSTVAALNLAEIKRCTLRALTEAWQTEEEGSFSNLGAWGGGGGVRGASVSGE